MLPSTDIKELVIDEEVINDPEKFLERILQEDGIKRFQKDFLVEHGTFLEFEEAAAEKLSTLAKERNMKIKDLCEELFHDYFHGMRLMNLENFTIPAEAVDAPQDYLDDYIKNYYKK